MHKGINCELRVYKVFKFPSRRSLRLRFENGNIVKP